MKKDISISLIFAVCFSSLLISCAPKNNNIDFDFSKLKRPKKINTIDKVKKVNDDFEKNSYIQDLIPLKNKQEILSNTKFGKKDPFSVGDLETNQFNLDFKLKGFLHTEFKKYAIVEYLNKEGTLTEESIGEINTNLLPKDAKVINIDPESKKLIISIDNKNFIFEI